MKLLELVQKINGSFDGDGSIEIHGVAGIREAGPGEVSFVANLRYAADAAATKASAVIVSEDWYTESPAQLIRVKNPDAAFAEAAVLFYTPPPEAGAGVHPSSVVAPDAKLGQGVSIGPQCVIESGAVIGEGTVISAQCYVGFRSEIGAHSFLYPQVSLREFTKIGNRTVIHNGTVIGSDGFGYSVDGDGVRTKIPQIGTVEIGNDVEIGANVTVDRARFGKTKIGNGVKIDNLVQIAHNVIIGDHCVIIAQVAIAGSVHVGNKVIFAGQSGVAGHLCVGDGAVIGAKAAVTKDVPAGAYMIGVPALPAQKFKKTQAGIMLIPKLKERLAALAERVSKLEKQADKIAE
ncbi:MAG: UDP-3-O-(3-hydroxymyristoyl)glucosamine N-acyltransferase [Pontiellaceae bacterium]|nr:UDP-3-O-(3-hydroxymyristoyl)glucosamine N-acyltransferase [Pontiellaceae bacterium]